MPTAAATVLEVQPQRSPEEALLRAVALVEARAAHAHEYWLIQQERDADTLCRDAHDDYFQSGSNDAGYIDGLSMAAENVGVAANELGPEGEAALGELAGLLTKVFVDSGAFSEVDFNPAPFVVEAITDEEWEKRIGLYLRLAPVLTRQLYVVAPDKVAFQQETIDRVSRYAYEMRLIRSTGANVIMPVQKGALPMAAMYQLCNEILGFTAIAGIPMKSDATTLADLSAFCAEAKPAEIHLLGLGPSAARWHEAVAAVQAVSPTTRIYSDSVRLRSLLGTNNGPGARPSKYPSSVKKGPRVLTEQQELARAELGLQASKGKRDGSSRKVKRVATQRVALAFTEDRVSDEKAKGWYDTELFASWDEAQAWEKATPEERDHWIYQAELDEAYAIDAEVNAARAEYDALPEYLKQPAVELYLPEHEGG